MERLWLGVGLKRLIPMTMHWTAADIPSQAGRRVLITGANSGIGYMAALKLARKDAKVLLACRDQRRGEAAIARIISDSPGADVELVVLDLASLESVREVAARQLDRGLGIDLLINNAGVMTPPKRKETKDGFELQFGTNVLGHFALTGLLMPALERAAASAEQDPRVVTIASIAHKRGRIDFDDLQSTKQYGPMKAYQQSKLANLLFAFELDRRLKAKGSRVLSVAAHPGVSETNLFLAGDYPAYELAVRRGIGAVIGTLLNTDAEGALPTLYAAIAPDAVGGGYYGPQGFQEMRGGDVGLAKVSPQARDQAAATRLWDVCQQLTGVQFM
jgi:NAD(P)-dependent dehydrogenase (short-subunit alcohol dehydrogenase family)